MKFILFVRATVSVVLIVLLTAGYSLVMLVVSSFRKFPVLEDKIILNWSSLILRLLNVKLTVQKGVELPEAGSVVLFNHASYFDIPILIKALQGYSIRFGAKIELFSIPLFGHAMRLAGVLPIARGNREKVIRVYQRATKNLKKGRNYALAPEGGRTHGDKIEDFKSGPFIFAIMSEKPLVPVVIKGADHVMAKKDLLPGLRSWKFGVEVTVLQPVQTMGMNMDDRLSLKDLVRSQMVLAFDDGEKVKDAFVNVLHQNDLRQKELSQEELLK